MNQILCLPQIKRFLGVADAAFRVHLNLVVQVVMGAALIMASILAKQRRYTGPGICQTTLLLLNLLTIPLVILSSYHQQVGPVFPRVFRKCYFTVAIIHTALGTAPELLGLYMVVVAATNIFPRRLCLKRWKRWMHAELMLWSAVLFSGLWTYYVWYIAPLF